MCIHRDSGVGDHGVPGIQSFLDEHACGPVCKKLRLERLTTTDEHPCSPGPGEEEPQSELGSGSDPE